MKNKTESDGLSARPKLTIASMLAILIALVLGQLTSLAQSTAFPDPTVVYTSIGTSYNTALSWAIGAIAVTVVLGWVLFAIRRRK